MKEGLNRNGGRGPVDSTRSERHSASTSEGVRIQAVGWALVERPIWPSGSAANGHEPLFYCLGAPPRPARFPQEHPRPLY